jgi:hypothetical protein
MKTLNSLNELIYQNRKVLNVSLNSFDVFMESGKLEAGSNKEDDNGLHYADYRYQLALQIENMHADRGGILLVLLHQWVTALEYRSDLDAPDIVTTVLTGQKLDVEMTLEVRDPIYLTRDDEGPIVIRGQKYSFGDHVLNVAESVTVTGSIKL